MQPVGPFLCSPLIDLDKITAQNWTTSSKALRAGGLQLSLSGPLQSSTLECLFKLFLQQFTDTYNSLQFPAEIKQQNSNNFYSFSCKYDYFFKDSFFEVPYTILLWPHNTNFTTVHDLKTNTFWHFHHIISSLWL